MVSKGHPYDHDAFLAMFEEGGDVELTLVQQPAAQVILQPDNVADYDAVLFYDMSGMQGHGARADMPGGDGLSIRQVQASITIRTCLFFAQRDDLEGLGELVQEGLLLSRTFSDHAEIGTWRRQVQELVNHDSGAPVEAAADKDQDR